MWHFTKKITSYDLILSLITVCMKLIPLSYLCGGVAGVHTLAVPSWSVSVPWRLWLNESREAWLVGAIMSHKSLVPLISLQASYQCNSWVRLREEPQEAPALCVRGLNLYNEHQSLRLLIETSGGRITRISGPPLFSPLLLGFNVNIAPPRATDELEDCAESLPFRWFIWPPQWIICMLFRFYYGGICMRRKADLIEAVRQVNRAASRANTVFKVTYYAKFSQ